MYLIETLKPKYIYYVLGLRRSGNHLLISWIISNFKNVLFFNDLDKKPLIDKKYHENELRTKYIYREKQKFYEDFNNNLLCINDEWNNVECLILSFEDKSIENFIQVYDFFKIKAEYKYKVIVLRDLLNCLSSRLEGQETSVRRLEADEITLKYWLEYYNNTCCVILNYNQFIFSKKYRNTIKDKVGLTIVPKKILQSVPQFFCGSSFEKGKIERDDKDFLSCYTRYYKFQDVDIIKMVLETPNMFQILEDFNIYKKIALCFDKGEIYPNWYNFLITDKKYMFKTNIYFITSDFSETKNSDILNQVCIICSEKDDLEKYIKFSRFHKRLVKKYSRQDYHIINFSSIS